MRWLPKLILLIKTRGKSCNIKTVNVFVAFSVLGSNQRAQMNNHLFLMPLLIFLKEKEKLKCSVSEAIVQIINKNKEAVQIQQ